MITWLQPVRSSLCPAIVPENLHQLPMAKRDPELTARNKVIDGLTTELRKLLPKVLAEIGIQPQ